MTRSSEVLLAWLYGAHCCASAARIVIKALSFLLGGSAVLLGFQYVEYHHMPVIKAWSMEYIERDADAYVVGGYLTKARACELLAVSILAVPRDPSIPRSLVHQARPDDILGGNVPTGRATWGPWRVRLPATVAQRARELSHLEVVGTHRCHALWTQDTLYGAVQMEALK